VYGDLKEDPTILCHGCEWRGLHKTATPLKKTERSVNETNCCLSLDTVLAVSPYLRSASTRERIDAILTQNSKLRTSLQSGILVFWLVTLCSKVTGFRRADGTYNHHLLGEKSPGTFFNTPQPLKMKGVRSVEMSGKSSPTTRPNDPQDLNH